MRTTRRLFLRLLAVLAGTSFTGWPQSLRANEATIDIHGITRNTFWGAIGAGLRRAVAPLAPFKPYPGGERLGLGTKPAPTGGSLVDALSWEPSNGRRRALSRADLASLLYFANGDTGRGDGDPYKLRAAPSAGALYAGELYVVALAVEGLDAGVYYYDVGHHELVRLRGAVERMNLLATVEVADEVDGAALVCVTNMFARYSRRYANRGYRYALIDTGHIAENLRLTATGMGRPVRSITRFHDDRFHDLLAVDGRDEAVCAVLVLTGESKKAGVPSRRFVEKGERGAPLSEIDDATLRYHEAAKLVEVANEWASDAASGSREQRAAVEFRAAIGPKPQVSLQQAIVSRRSPLAFARRAIAREQLDFVLAMAKPAGARGNRVAVELHAIVHRVDQVAAGLYGYLPSERRLAVTREGDFTDSLPRACMRQAKAGDAAVALLMVASIREAAARHGPRSYRDLLIEAGEIGERIYLAAESLGLSARNLAAFLDDDLNDLVGLDGRERAVVHLTMLGHAAG